ncbi:hypothetical protein BDD12DRAFT_888419 [Trichophaea hybrida]|nr:hypothetical protein BDD12DRAFT_888419 [Trichophaea hybrida]
MVFSPTLWGIPLVLALYCQLHYLGYSPTSSPLPWNSPKRLFLLHEALLPQLLTFLACWIPVNDRKLVAAIFLPPLATCYWQLMGAGSLSPATGYAIGTFVSSMGFKALEVLVFRDLRGMRRLRECPRERRKEKVEATHNTKGEGEGELRPSNGWRRAGWVLELQHNLRGVGWNWCVSLPTPSMDGPDVWIAKRVLRGTAMYAWLDFLVFWTRSVDHDFFLPKGHAMGFFPPPAGKPYNSLFAKSIHSTWDFPPPVGFWDMPTEDGWKRNGYQLALHTLRILLSASAMFTAISGMYTSVALICVCIGTLVGTSRGWKRRWFAPEAWPDAFGHWMLGNYGGGIKGWWGKGWHGLFKSIFTAPVRGIVDFFGLKGGFEAALMLTIPFCVSAVLHFCGCWTQSSGGWGAARFFLVQPLGIVFETVVAEGYKLFLRPEKSSRWLVRGETVLVYLWAVVWFVVTSESFFEEYRWGGLWVVEPIPFSFWRWMRGERWTVWVTAEGGRAWWRWANGLEGGLLGDWGIVIV